MGTRRRTPARRRTTNRAGAAASLGVLGVLCLLGLGGYLAVSAVIDRPDPVALPACDEVDDPAGGVVAGYTGAQLDHAAEIMAAGERLGFGLAGQRLGVLAAMGESGLRNLDYGDWETSGVRNPDGTPTSSLGLFQQQDWWGSEAERTDPATAATLFFDRLDDVDGWERMEPSHAIHRVQVNTDPDHYTRWLGPSGEVAVALACG